MIELTQGLPEHSEVILKSWMLIFLGKVLEDSPPKFMGYFFIPP
jgi:hypothetical protein